MRRGFTLLEVLFAVFLVSICALIVLATVPIANTSRTKADYMSKATSLAEKEIEQVRAVGYLNLSPTQLYQCNLIDSAQPVSANTYSFTNTDLGANDSPSSLLPKGAGTVSVTQLTNYLRTITVCVTWTEGSKQRSAQIGTVVMNL